MRNRRNEFVTPFWRAAFDSLPAGARSRYALHLKAAERWELRLDALIEAWTRAKTALEKPFQTPSSAH